MSWRGAAKHVVAPHMTKLAQALGEDRRHDIKDIAATS